MVVMSVTPVWNTSGKNTEKQSFLMFFCFEFVLPITGTHKAFVLTLHFNINILESLSLEMLKKCLSVVLRDVV